MNEDEVKQIISDFRNELASFKKDQDSLYEVLGQINTSVQLLIQKIDTLVIPKMEITQAVLYGDPKDASDNSGLIATVQSLKQENKNFKWIFGTVWSLVVIGLSQIFNWILKK